MLLQYYHLQGFLRIIFKLPKENPQSTLCGFDACAKWPQKQARERWIAGQIFRLESAENARRAAPDAVRSETWALEARQLPKELRATASLVCHSDQHSVTILLGRIILNQNSDGIQQRSEI